MSIAIKYLEKLKGENILVDVYTDHYDDSFYGFIIKFNDDFLLLEHYTNDLIYNGVIIFRRDDITRIKWSGNGLNSSLKLIDSSTRVTSVNDIRIDSIESILDSISLKYKHVTLQIQNIDKGMCIIGEIEDIDSESIVINEFGTKSTLDRGFLLIALNEITRIDAGGIYETNLLKLHNKTV